VATLVKKVMLRIAADDGDTESKLDKISAKADELARKHPDIKIRIDSAAASSSAWAATPPWRARRQPRQAGRSACRTPPCRSTTPPKVPPR